MPTISKRSRRSRSPANTPASILLKHPSPALWLIGLCDGSGAILSKKATEELGDKIATTLIGSGPIWSRSGSPTSI